ncbi:MAG: ammonium transporter [Hyphomicrobium sp.]|nr:ammonium transporter [Hyphomicrobium sp.]
MQGLAAGAFALAASAMPALAAPTPNNGDTAFMMMATILVLLMTVPGLALFYGGLVRTKNMLSMCMQVFATLCLVMILWVTYGYSMAFTNGGGLNSFVGGFSKTFLTGVDSTTLAATFSNGVYIPEYVYICFQMTFACITPALILGAIAERIKFSAVMLFMALWVTFIYFPMAHMVWYWGGPDAFGNASAAVKAAEAAVAAATDTALLDAAKTALITAGVGEEAVKALADAAAVKAAADTRMGEVASDVGMLFGWGALDFAGGTVVHINAGIAGLVGCLLLGKRIGYGKEAMPPHSLVMCMVGAALLWVGWFGFNVGSNLEANAFAGQVMINTFVATAGAALSWMIVEWLAKGKPSLLGLVSGVIAGLVAITPACGFAGVMGSIVLGLVAGVVCFVFCSAVKHAFGYDDSLDVFGIHCVGGVLGAIGTGILVAPSLGGTGIPDYTSVPGTLQVGAVDIANQVMIQAKAVGFTLLFSGLGSLILFVLVGLIVGLRPSEEKEREGLDITDHGERAYNY